MEGDQSTMFSRSLGFKFEKCQGDNCKDDLDNWLMDIQVDMWIIEEMIDPLQYITRPTNQIQRMLNSHIFAETIIGKIIPVEQIELVKNEFFMEDDWFQIGQISKNGSYFNVKDTLLWRKFAQSQNLLLLEHTLFLCSAHITHKRKIYDIVALLGDLGGVTEVITLVLGCLLFRISKSSYNMMSTKRMFLARTKDDELFDEADEKNKKKWFLTDTSMPPGIQKKLKQEVQKHRVIKFSIKDKLCYYLMN